MSDIIKQGCARYENNCSFIHKLFIIGMAKIKYL